MRKIIVGLVVLLALFIFAVVHVPTGSSEYKAKQIEKIFDINNDEAIKLAFEKEFNALKKEERLAVIDDLSFEVISNNKALIIKILNNSVPNWQESDSFNIQYLKTESDIINRKNEKIIQDVEKLKKTVEIRTVNDFIKELDILMDEGWDTDIGDYFLVSGKNELKFETKLGEMFLVFAKLDVMDIKTGYVYNISYNKTNLYLTPTFEKIEDAGYYEISDVLYYFDIDKLVRFSNLEKKSVDNEEEKDEVIDIETIVSTPNRADFSGKVRVSIKDTIYSDKSTIENVNLFNIRRRMNQYYLLEGADSIADMVYVASVSVLNLNKVEGVENVIKSTYFNVFKDSIRPYQKESDHEENAEDDN